MSKDRDIIHVSRSNVIRSSPSAYRKSQNECSPSKLPVCTGSLFSSSISKGQSTYSGRRGTRATLSETVLLPLSCERNRLVGDKTPTKRSAILTFPGLGDDGIWDHQQQGFLVLEPTGMEDDKEIIKEASFSDENWYRHIPDTLLQPSCSEKVIKWLEESQHSLEDLQHSSLTDVTDNQSVYFSEEHNVYRKEPCSMATRVPAALDYQKWSQLEDISPENFTTAQSPSEFPVEKLKGFSRLSAAKLLMSYMKVIFCLSVVYMGFLWRTRPASWDYYEPPPT